MQRTVGQQAGGLNHKFSSFWFFICLVSFGVGDLQTGQPSVLVRDLRQRGDGPTAAVDLFVVLYR